MSGASMGGAWRQLHRLFIEGTAAGLPDSQLLERFCADAFQATFLVLVCKARSIRGREALRRLAPSGRLSDAVQAGAAAARKRRRSLTPSAP